MSTVTAFILQTEILKHKELDSRAQEGAGSGPRGPSPMPTPCSTTRDQDRRGAQTPLSEDRQGALAVPAVSDLSGGINTTNVTELFPGFIHTQNYSWKTPFCTCFTSKGHGASTSSQFWFQYTCTNFRKTLIL